MKKDDTKLPYKISEYVTEHFREDFLFEVKEVKKLHGNFFYTIEVSKDDHIYYFLFNEKGDLVSEGSESAFPADIHDDLTLEDNPE